jgi:hypothetical protein
MKIFRACIALGYIPLSWRVVRVIFIPKSECNNYVQAKSFHVISLISSLSKHWRGW